jgi:hypothetical protein
MTQRVVTAPGQTPSCNTLWVTQAHDLVGGQSPTSRLHLARGSIQLCRLKGAHVGVARTRERQRSARGWAQSLKDLTVLG